MSATLVGTRVLLRSRDRATTVLTVLAFALPHAVLLAVLGGVLTFFSRSQHPLNAAMQEGSYLIYAGFAAVLIVVPVLSMGAAAARLGLSRRSRDLAILRLLGLSPARAKLASVFETCVHAVVGVLAGSALYAVTLPIWPALSFQQTQLSVPEMWVGPWFLLAAAGLMVVLAATSAWIAMRRVAITPLGVARRSEAQRVSPIGVVAVVIVVVLWLGPAQLVLRMGMGPAVMVTMLLGFLALIFALVNVIGVWLIGILGRIMVKASRSPQLLLAGRRVIDDPKSIWRSFGAVALVGFVVGVLYPMFSMVGMSQESLDPIGATMVTDIGTGMLLTLGITLLLGAISTAVNQAIRIIDEAAETRSLLRAGAPVGFLDATRRLEVGIPALILLGGSLGMGLVFVSPFAATAGSIAAVLFVIAFGGAGLLLIMGASESTRLLSRRLVAEVASV